MTTTVAAQHDKTSRWRTIIGPTSGGQLVLLVLLLLVVLLPKWMSSSRYRSRVAFAQMEVERMADALSSFYGDCGSLPAAITKGDVDLLVGPGAEPQLSSPGRWRSGQMASLSGWLSGRTEGAATTCWKGKRLSLDVEPDPWSHRYAVNIGGQPNMDRAHAVWVLSAGPNRVIETPFEQVAVAARLYGDDIGARIDRVWLSS